MGRLEVKSKVRRAVDQVKRHWNQFNNKKVVPESSIPPSKRRHHIKPIGSHLLGVTESRAAHNKKDSIASTATATAKKSITTKAKKRKTVSKTRKTKSSK